jgi:SAM-dependent methyltransferase
MIFLALNMDNEETPFWERQEVVERFAARSPDQRMMELLAGAPKSTRVLDLGCAGGRNTEWLAREGFDFYAFDGSKAMLDKTRSRVAPLIGKAEAERRVVEGRIEDLGVFADNFFDLILGFGVYHAAQSNAEWDKAISESARVLKPQAQLLMTQFSPRSNPTGEGLQEVEPHLFVGFRGERRMVLLEPDELDAWMARHGFTPIQPTYEATTPSDEGGTRVVVSGFYRKSV